MKEYKKKKIKCYIENQMKVDHERRKLPPNEVKQIEKLVEKIHHAKQDRKTGRLKRLVSKLESRGVEVKFQEEHISWQIKEQ